ncbi:MAG: protein kinase [Thermoanaerobaculia bacterium]
MTLTAGTRLGPYEILAPLGAGGMGEVYRAKDTRLGRDVAIKVLPEEFFEDKDRVARFEREAKSLAALNHPGIAAIYSFEEISGRHLLVMELVEGEDLGQKLLSGPIPLEESLSLSRQIAEALEAAHEKGIVHRDLKPANVKVTPDGRVKLLDFGLAKVFEGDPSNEKSGSGGALTKSPTLTARATAAGVILGTAAYMSPEQARGKPLDKRTDVWAFGCVLYEMLTGKRAFEGETVSDTLAAVLTKEPDWSALRAPGVSSKVAELLRRCLQREAKQRLRDIGDARIAIEEELGASGTSSGQLPFEEEQAVPNSTVGRRAQAVSARGSRKYLWISWGIAAAFAAAAGALALRARAPEVVPEEVTRFTVQLPEGSRLVLDDVVNMALSADGRKVVMQALDEKTGMSHLVLRSLDELHGTTLSGSEGASNPFFSPDGGWVGFFADGKLKKLLLSGGNPVMLADAPAPRGGCWAPDDTIVYSPEYASGLLRVSASGGAPIELAKPDPKKNERTFRWPDALPNGAGILFTIGWENSPQSYDGADIAVIADGTIRTVVKGASTARFVEPGWLVFVRLGTLFAIAFDPKTATVHGEPFPVLREVGGDPTSGVSYFSVARNGTLAWVPGSAMAGQSWLTLMDRGGKPTRLPLPPQDYNAPTFSPDGRRLAFNVGKGRGGLAGDVWTISLSDLALSRLTFDEYSAAPVWSPDGKQIAFVVTAGESPGIHRKPADGSGPATAIGEPSSRAVIAAAWSPDGRLLAYTDVNARELRLVDVETGKSRVFASDASAPAFSPDGRYIAYNGIVGSGGMRVFVRPLEGDAIWQASPDLGGFPKWSGNGRELFFIQNSRVMKVEVETHPLFRAGPAQVVFGGLEGYSWRTNPIVNWDVSSDGRRFSFVEFRREGSQGRQVAIALNWRQTLGAEAVTKGAR